MSSKRKTYINQYALDNKDNKDSKTKVIHGIFNKYKIDEENSRKRYIFRSL